MSKTNVAVIGLGGIAQLVHLPYLSRINNARVTAVAEINKNRLNTIADKFGIQSRYEDYQELLENSDAEAVIIATPTNTHKEVALACLNANKDIMVEKPLARTYVEAKEIVAAAKKRKRILMVGMNLRFRPDAMILKSILNSGEIGEPFYIRCTWLRRPSSSGKWLTRKEMSGGGVIIDLGILLLDLALWLLNYPQVDTVSTQNYQQLTRQVEDSSMSFIRCKNSSLITIESSWSLTVEKDAFNIIVYGKRGQASISPIKVFKTIEENIIDMSPTQTENAVAQFKKSYMNELKSFIGAVRGLNPIISSGEEAESRMKVIDAMYKSAEQKSEIKL
ncbi:MAG: Gfo/Idh/MocA family oxidoreductase [Ignavibacteriaceae bacterium]